jgi:hypothetical protein
MYLYHVLFGPIKICGIDYQKRWFTEVEHERGFFLTVQCRSTRKNCFFITLMTQL